MSSLRVVVETRAIILQKRAMLCSKPERHSPNIYVRGNIKIKPPIKVTALVSQATLSEAPEKFVVELRKTLFLRLYGLLVITREFICLAAPRSILNLTLKRYGVLILYAIRKALEAFSSEKTPKKSSNDYAPGFIHIAIKNLLNNL